MLFALDAGLIFPPVHLAEPDGLLAIGGDLSSERLLLAYRSGIFPWYEGDRILWWSPDPRFVLYPEELVVSKSMKSLLKKNAFRFTVNNAFPEVIRHCKTVRRPGQDSTWITEEVEKAYMGLFNMGVAYSAEVWEGERLVGGLYGLKMGGIFFGESMFSLVSNASKYAFISFVEQLNKTGVELIDCQVYTDHLKSLGARMIDREIFIEEVHRLTEKT